jgi:hypothetical protein
MGDGGTESTGITLEDFVTLGLENGNWKKINDSEWIYRISKVDPVTNKKKKVTCVFSRFEDEQTKEFFKNDVILTRLNIDNVDMTPKEIWVIGRTIVSGIYPNTVAGKMQIERDEQQNNLEKEALLKEEEARRLEDAEAKEEERKKDEEKRAYLNSEAGKMEIERDEQQKKLEKEAILEEEEALRVKDAEAKEEERKKDEEKRVAKEMQRQQRLKDVEGHYINKGGFRGGEMDVRVVSENEVVVTGHSNGCSLTSKSVKIIKYNEERDEFEAELSFTDSHDRRAQIPFTFRKFDSNIAKIQGGEFCIVISDSTGYVPQYCEKGGTFLGTYVKLFSATK